MCVNCYLYRGMENKIRSQHEMIVELEDKIKCCTAEIKKVSIMTVHVYTCTCVVPLCMYTYTSSYVLLYVHVHVHLYLYTM